MFLKKGRPGVQGKLLGSVLRKQRPHEPIGTGLERSGDRERDYHAAVLFYVANEERLNVMLVKEMLNQAFFSLQAIHPSAIAVDAPVFGFRLVPHEERMTLLS